jgi:hypothetical protein
MYRRNLRHSISAWKWDVLGKSARYFGQGGELLEFFVKEMRADGEGCGVFIDNGGWEEVEREVGVIRERVEGRRRRFMY